MEVETKRGFITLATGDLRYYKLALNLLKSYRLNANCHDPFAIVADRENKYTKEFDYVMKLDNPTFSYNDKLRLFDYLPFEETIFIDADCLIYDDLNSWWERFSQAGDFSAFGVAHNINSGKGWFQTEGMKEYKDLIRFEPVFNGGVYYMRRTLVCEHVFAIAKSVALNYQNYKFNGFKNPADEPLLALGMAVCNCKPILNENGAQVEYIFAPKSKFLDANILVPKANYYYSNSKKVSARLIHWSNYLAEKRDYKYQIFQLNNKTNSLLVRSLLSLYDYKAFFVRAIRFIKRKTKK